MTTVLFLAFEFPPVNTTGMHRSAKLAKYLGEFDIQPIVITLRAQDSADAFQASIESSSLDDLPTNLVVYALPAPPTRPVPKTRLGKYLSIFGRVEDPLAKRVRPALARALPAIVARHRPSAVYVSLPPFSAGGLAVEMARALRLPLVVDMRDGWSHWCAGAFPTYVHWALVRRRERRLFEQAAAVVTVTEQLAAIFRRSHPGVPKDRFRVIPNGYDGSLGLSPTLAVPPRKDAASVTIGYLGSYYYMPEARDAALTPWWRRSGHRKLHYQPVREDWLYRSPYFFLRALAALRRQDPALGARVRFVHVGRKPPWLDKMVAELGVSDAVNCMGVVPHAQVLDTVRGFDALLCTSVKVEGGEDYAIASKTFDYLLAGRPIVGFVTSGAQQEFLRRCGAALVADADDLEAGTELLARVARGGFELSPDVTFLASYHRRSSAARMATILRTAIELNGTLSPRFRKGGEALRAPDS